MIRKSLAVPIPRWCSVSTTASSTHSTRYIPKNWDPLPIHSSTCVWFWKTSIRPISKSSVKRSRRRLQSMPTKSALNSRSRLEIRTTLKRELPCSSSIHSHVKSYRINTLWRNCVTLFSSLKIATSKIPKRYRLRSWSTSSKAEWKTISMPATSWSTSSPFLRVVDAIR